MLQNSHSSTAIFPQQNAAYACCLEVSHTSCVQAPTLRWTADRFSGNNLEQTRRYDCSFKFLDF